MARTAFNCPAEMALSLIGGKWKVIIFWLLRRGPQRSGKIRAQLPGISPAAFSLALRELEGAGLVKRHVKSTVPLAVTYELTERAAGILPIVRALVKWGLENQKHYTAEDFGMAAFYSSRR